VNWSGIEPRKGQYDKAYLKKAEQLIAACHAHGVFTVVDLHQDAWSKEIGEDGAPLWAIVPPPTKLLQGPLNDLNQRRLSGQVLAAFGSFFDNKQGLQEAYAAMAVVLARALAHLPGFVGLELMNEPVLFNGDHKLDAFHLKVGQALRQALPRLGIYFEPNSLRNMNDDAPVNTPYPLKNSVYSPHIYTGVFTGNWKSGDVARIRTSVQKAQKEASAHKAPLWIGEFGNDPQKALGREWITAALTTFDEVRASWAFWVYEEHSQGSWGFYDTAAGHTRGEVRADLVKIMARPFPARLAASLKTISWDAARQTLTVKMERPLQAKHLFTVPGKTYPAGVTVKCDGKKVATSTPRPGRILFNCTGDAITVAPGS
jgi:endoglycosylceramidase